MYWLSASQCGFYSGAIESVLTQCISVWYGNGSNQDCFVQSCAWLSAFQGLLSPLCRTSTSNAAKAELLKSSRTQITPVTIFSVYCHLASASGAWWQKLRDWGGASSLRPSGSLTQTQFHNHLQDSLSTVKTFIFSSSVLLLCVHTRYNPFAHPSCTSLFILLFIKSTVYCIAHLNVLHILIFICSYFYFIFVYLYLYIFSCVVLHILHCPLSGPVLIYISLLIISCIIEYVTNTKKPWT